MAGPLPEVAGALEAWGDVTFTGPPLGPGVRNRVWPVTVNGRRAVARLGRRHPAALDWELDLLDHLRANGVGVPDLIPAADGSRHARGLTVLGWVEGREPAGAEDWRAVGDVLRRAHALTTGWPQRPGFLAARDLVDANRGGDVAVDALPPDVRERCRDAWRAVGDVPVSAIHGDPSRTNVRITERGVVLIDWDEARVDAPLFDLAEVERRSGGTDLDSAAQRAALAWDVAVCWRFEPEYARRRLRELEASSTG